MQTKHRCGIVILAAGKGKRMLSNTAKVLQPLHGQPLLYYVLNQVNQALPDVPIAIVVGHEKEAVENAVKSLKYSQQSFNHAIEFIHQPEQKGTGDALRCVMESDWGKDHIEKKIPILVLPGDMPLIPSTLIQQMASPLKESEALRLLTCHLPQPQGYGRIVRIKSRDNNPISHIVEERDATAEEKKIKEIAVSTYLFDAEFLEEKLPLLSNQNAQGEYYLTDLVAMSGGSKSIASLIWDQAEDLMGINDPWDLAQVSSILNQTKLKQLAKKGVRILDTRNIFIESTVKIEEGVTIYPGVTLEGRTHVKKGAILRSNVYLKNVEVGENAELKAGTIAEQSKIEANAKIGPYAHLRPDSYVGNSAKIGNFVELKNTRIGERTSVAHLSYLGDAEVGKDVNIGCGFVTCNFDGRTINGRRKHPTFIEDEAFVGSDCQAVAPIRIGKGAYVASGSTLTDDVPPESLAIARSKQVNKEGYARRLRSDNAKKN